MESAQGNILQGKTNIESVQEVFGLLVLKPSLLASKPTMLQTSTQCYKQICQKCAISGLQHWGLANHWRSFAFGSSCYFKGLMMTPSFMGFKKRKDAARCLQHCILASFHPFFFFTRGGRHAPWLNFISFVHCLTVIWYGRGNRGIHQRNECFKLEKCAVSTQRERKMAASSITML